MNKSMMNVLQKYAEHITHLHDDPEELAKNNEIEESGKYSPDRSSRKSENQKSSSIKKK